MWSIIGFIIIFALLLSYPLFALYVRVFRGTKNIDDVKFNFRILFESMLDDLIEWIQKLIKK